MTEYRRVLLDGAAVLTTRHGDTLVAADGREVGVDEAVHLPPTEPTKIVAVHLNYASRTRDGSAARERTVVGQDPAAQECYQGAAVGANEPEANRL